MKTLKVDPCSTPYFYFEYVINEASCEFCLFGALIVAQLIKNLPKRHKALISLDPTHHMNWMC